MCEILKNTKIKKLIIVFLIILLLINIFPSKVQAAGFLESAGGVIIDTILDFFIFLGDTILNVLQNNFISAEDVVIQAQSDACDSVALKDIVMLVIGIVIIVVSVVIAIGSYGSLSGPAAMGFAAGVKFVGGILLGLGIGGFFAVEGGSNLFESLSGKFDLPLIRYTPYEIFSNQIPVFDINFIKPMDSITENVTSYDKVYGQGIYFNELVLQTVPDILADLGYQTSGANEQDLSITDEYDQIIDEICGKIYYDDVETKQEEGDDAIYEYFEFNIDGVQFTLFTSEVWGMFVEFYKTSDLNSYNDGTSPYQDTGEFSIASFDLRVTDEIQLEQAKEEFKQDLKYYFSNIDGSYEELKSLLESKKALLEGQAPFRDYIEFPDRNKEIHIIYLDAYMEGGMEKYKIYSPQTSEVEYKSSASLLQKGISTWYNVLRRIALVGLLSVLVYVGIRIVISSASADRAKYKKMFLNWLVAVCILFVLHYLMVLILTMSTKITEIFVAKGEENIFVKLPADTTIDGYGLAGGKSGEKATEEDPPIWSCSFTGYLRLVAGAYGQEDTIGLTNFAYGIMYLIMVIYTVIFTVMYLRRVLYMAFLTMIAPLIALTYPLDKIKDGKAQALGLWLREYIFNALLQPIHLILYVMIVSNVMDYVVDHPVYAIVALGFLLPAEKFIRKLFGFEKRDTFDDNLANMVGGAAVMSGVGKLSALNKPRKPQEDNKDDKIRTADNTPNESFEVPKIDNVQSIPETNNSSSGENVTVQHSSSTASGTSQSSGTTAIPKLNVPKITPAKNKNNDRRFSSKVASGFLNVGYEARKRSLKAKPLKTIGKYTGMALGGATLGLLGLVAGISTGELDNTIKFTASGLGVGGMVGGTLGANAGEWTSEQKENFLKGYHGSEEYNNARFDKNFLASEELRDMINNNNIHSEMRGGLSQEVKRARAIASEAQEYHKVGITDANQIKACMEAGLTSEEGRYAIELAKTMKKGKIDSPQKQAEYKRKYREAFQSQNSTSEKDKKIEDIWNTATRIRFK